MFGVRFLIRAHNSRKRCHLHLRSVRDASQLSRLSAQEIDAKWQTMWSKTNLSQGRERRPKSYILPMFAYPSGSLHMGHLRVYTISDVIARYRQLQGDDVLHPTGWDAFGLPAENAAIERGIDPSVWTEENIGKMKAQLKSMNTSFNWDAEISTCSPSFYKHTQRLFLMLYEQGLAYQAEALVNYDPVDKTVLANEQVDSSGRSWRSGALVQQINLRQWFFKITAFKEALLNDLDALSKDGRWPDRVVTQQRNWLGRSQGARIRFDFERETISDNGIHVFTTRPDTLYGVKYLALSLSHPLVLQLANSLPDLQAFLNKKASFAPDTKAGFRLPITALSPLADSTIASIPVYAAPYVLENYGEGAVMGVPAHDARDLAFWKEHQPNDTIPIVIQPFEARNEELYQQVSGIAEAYSGPGVLSKLSGKYAGLASEAAASSIVSDLEQNGFAEPVTTWKLRDWLVSRQRYWGAPIPIIHCKDCGAVPVPEEDLPVTLPKLDASFQGQRGNPLDKIPDFVNCKCPKCSGDARRETDTMDTFVDSSWYFMRFPDPHNEKEFFSHMSSLRTMPVDTYVGGVEHAILHLLYARFIYKFLCSEGLVPGASGEREPFKKLIAQGMVHGRTLSDPDTGRFLLPHEVDPSGEQPVIKATGKTPNITYEKMSKSKYNGVDPSTCISKFGADAVRAHILFAAPVSEVLQWDEEKVVGIQRWFGRIERLVSRYLDLTTSSTTTSQSTTVPSQNQPSITVTRPPLQTLTETDSSTLLLVQSTIKSVSKTFETNIYSLNTTISDLTKLTNHLDDTWSPNLNPWVAQTALSSLLRMLAPIAPAYAEEWWEETRLGFLLDPSKPYGEDGDGKDTTTQQTTTTTQSNNHTSTIFNSSWPVPILTETEEAMLRSLRKTMTCAVQINGKLRFTADIPAPETSPLPADNSGGGSSGGKDNKQGLESKAERESKIVDALLATGDGQTWLTKKNDWEKRKRVVVVGGGKVVNVVF